MMDCRLLRVAWQLFEEDLGPAEVNLGFELPRPDVSFDNRSFPKLGGSAERACHDGLDRANKKIPNRICGRYFERKLNFLPALSSFVCSHLRSLDPLSSLFIRT